VKCVSHSIDDFGFLLGLGACNFRNYVLPRTMIQHVRQIERNEDYFIDNVLAELMPLLREVMGN
jgi:hypothetical protein